jgi:hypothetical protein
MPSSAQLEQFGCHIKKWRMDIHHREKPSVFTEGFELKASTGFRYL